MNKICVQSRLVSFLRGCRLRLVNMPAHAKGAHNKQTQLVLLRHGQPSTEVRAFVPEFHTREE